MRRTGLILLVALAVTACSADPDTTTTTVPPVTSVTTAPPAPTSTPPATGATTSTPPAAPLQSLAYEEIARLEFPVQVVARPGAGIAYVVLKEGRVMALDPEAGTVADDPVIDISRKIRNRGEQGLLAMALHPEDETRFYLHYSGGDGRTVVSEFVFETPTSVDPGSERGLLEVPQPASNHNGGMLAFAPDGTLILGLGDGGGSGDRYRNGQNPDTLLGGLVAIDVATGDASLYAMGLRNPWRFSIDGDLIYIADVGQNRYEEIDVARLEPGLNFGWPVMEGMHCYASSSCPSDGFVMPVVEVEHGDAGTCSITGGVVYRGSAIPEIDGHFFYSDFCAGYLRSFRYDGGQAVDATDWTPQVGRADGGVSGFGVDGAGEMYVTTDRALYRVVAVRG